jgi:hypothetical protein
LAILGIASSLNLLLKNYAWLKNKSDYGNAYVAGNAPRCTATTKNTSLFP